MPSMLAAEAAEAVGGLLGNDDSSLDYSTSDYSDDEHQFDAEGESSTATSLHQYSDRVTGNHHLDNATGNQHSPQLDAHQAKLQQQEQGNSSELNSLKPFHDHVVETRRSLLEKPKLRSQLSASRKRHSSHVKYQGIRHRQESVVQSAFENNGIIVKGIEPTESGSLQLNQYGVNQAEKRYRLSRGKCLPDEATVKDVRKRRQFNVHHKLLHKQRKKKLPRGRQRKKKRRRGIKPQKRETHVLVVGNKQTRLTLVQRQTILQAEQKARLMAMWRHPGAPKARPSSAPLFRENKFGQSTTITKAPPLKKHPEPSPTVNRTFTTLLGPRPIPQQIRTTLVNQESDLDSLIKKTKEMLGQIYHSNDKHVCCKCYKPQRVTSGTIETNNDTDASLLVHMKSAKQSISEKVATFGRKQVIKCQKQAFASSTFGNQILKHSPTNSKARLSPSKLDRKLAPYLRPVASVQLSLNHHKKRTARPHSALPQRSGIKSISLGSEKVSSTQRKSVQKKEKTSASNEPAQATSPAVQSNYSNRLREMIQRTKLELEETTRISKLLLEAGSPNAAAADEEPSTATFNTSNNVESVTLQATKNTTPPEPIFTVNVSPKRSTKNVQSKSMTSVKSRGNSPAAIVAKLSQKNFIDYSKVTLSDSESFVSLYSHEESLVGSVKKLECDDKSSTLGRVRTLSKHFFVVDEEHLVDQSANDDLASPVIQNGKGNESSCSAKHMSSKPHDENADAAVPGGQEFNHVDLAVASNTSTKSVASRGIANGVEVITGDTIFDDNLAREWSNVETTQRRNSDEQQSTITSVESEMRKPIVVAEVVSSSANGFIENSNTVAVTERSDAAASTESNVTEPDDNGFRSSENHIVAPPSSRHQLEHDTGGSATESGNDSDSSEATIVSSNTYNERPVF